MKIRIFICLVISFTVFFISCNARNKMEIESIHVSFYHQTFEAILPVKCDDIKGGISPSKALSMINEDPIEYSLNDENKGILDTMITNPTILVEIAKELKNLEPDSVNYPIDARISCIIEFKNKKIKKLCIGRGGISYCGIRQKQNNHLLYLIKQSIGYYSWMDDRVLEHLEELQDTSFKRDSVVGYSGRKF